MKQNVKRAKNEANVSSTFLVEIGKIRQVINITRSNLHKSLTNFLDINVPYIKDKTGVLTCGHFRLLVNNLSERRAYIIAVISHKIIALLSRYKSSGALIVFHCYSVLLPISTKEAFSCKTSSSYTARSEDSWRPFRCS